MTKSPEFYPRYVKAVFHRGKAEKLPMSYIDQEAQRVLNPDEMQSFYAVLESMIQSGEVVRDGEMLHLAQQ